MKKYQKDCKICKGTGTMFYVDKTGAQGESACPNKCWEWGSPPNLPKADAYSLLAEVRKIIEECSYIVDKDAVCEREVCNKFTLIEKLKLKFGSEQFR